MKKVEFVRVKSELSGYGFRDGKVGQVIIVFWLVSSTCFL